MGSAPGSEPRVCRIVALFMPYWVGTIPVNSWGSVTSTPGVRQRLQRPRAGGFVLLGVWLQAIAGLIVSLHLTLLPLGAALTASVGDTGLRACNFLPAPRVEGIVTPWKGEQCIWLQGGSQQSQLSPPPPPLVCTEDSGGW